MEERRKQCLLVEDEAIIAMMVSLELKNAGEEVVKTAATAEESVEYVRNHAIDVILMDIMLKGEVDGVQAAEQIREFSSVPIIFMTAYAERKNDPAVDRVQPLGFLTKPISFPQMKRLIESV